jgi:hypothetical protein
VRGFLTGGLVLIALGRILPDADAPGRVARLMRVPAELARRFLDPNVPAIGAARNARLGRTDKLPPLDAGTPAQPDHAQARPSSAGIVVSRAALPAYRELPGSN